MEAENASCIVHVRQIHKLGFGSPELLHEYCSRFWPVKRVAVSNAREKLEDASRPHHPLRVRPSGIGFVVMQRPEDAAAVLAAGEIQTVNGCQIRVRRFEAREGQEHHGSEGASASRSFHLTSLAESLHRWGRPCDGGHKIEEFQTRSATASAAGECSTTTSTTDEILSEASVHELSGDDRRDHWN
jgi:hypothetical protein